MTFGRSDRILLYIHNIEAVGARVDITATFVGCMQFIFRVKILNCL